MNLKVYVQYDITSLHSIVVGKSVKYHLISAATSPHKKKTAPDVGTKTNNESGNVVEE